MISDSMGEGGVELPFDVVNGWVSNGQRAFAAQVKQKFVPATFLFGGFELKAEQLNALSEAVGIDVPQAWELTTKSGKEGDYQVFCNRAAVCVPMGLRESWVIKDLRKRAPDFFEAGGKKARMHVQVLAYLARKDESGVYRPWVPAVLSAKGYQAKNLKKTFTEWKRTCGKVLQLSNSPEDRERVWQYWLPPIGTFGEQPVFQPVGSGESEITPIGLGLPPKEKLTRDYVEARFVGQDLAGQMREMNDMARDWLGAWAQPSDDNPTSDHIGETDEETAPAHAYDHEQTYD